MNKFFIESKKTYVVKDPTKLNRRSPFKFQTNDILCITDIKTNYILAWIARDGKLIRNDIITLKISDTDTLEEKEIKNFYDMEVKK